MCCRKRRIETGIQASEVGNAAFAKCVAERNIVQALIAAINLPDLALHSGVLHGQQPALRDHESRSHFREQIGGLLRRQAMLQEPVVVVDLESQSQIDHESPRKIGVTLAY